MEDSDEEVGLFGSVELLLGDPFPGYSPYKVNLRTER